MKFRAIITIGLVTTLLAAACSGGSTTAPGGDSGTPAEAASCNGGAFPDDAQFRQLICDVQGAELNVMAADAEVDITWGSRLTGAMSKYSTDRDTAVSELQDLITEINSSVP